MRGILFILFLLLSVPAYSSSIANDSFIDNSKKEILYDLYKKCGDNLISFKEIESCDSSKILLTSEILEENIKVVKYGNICFHIKKKCESFGCSINICIFELSCDTNCGFIVTQGNIKSLAPLYYKIFRKSNLIICLYSSRHPDIIPDYVNFIDESLLDRIINKYVINSDGNKR